VKVTSEQEATSDLTSLKLLMVTTRLHTPRKFTPIVKPNSEIDSRGDQAARLAAIIKLLKLHSQGD
jgi:hypothetical protein